MSIMQFSNFCNAVMHVMHRGLQRKVCIIITCSTLVQYIYIEEGFKKEGVMHVMHALLE